MDQQSEKQDSGSHPTGRSKRKKGMKKNEDSIRDLWDNIKCTNIRIIGVPEGEEREKGMENLFEEIMAENSPNLVGKQTSKSIKHKESQTR